MSPANNFYGSGFRDVIVPDSDSFEKMKKISLRPNKVIKYLILSDFAFWTGWGLLTPVFAIFIVSRIEGGSVFVVGMASAVFWIARSLFRVPIGVLLDILPTEKDDYLALVAGFFIASLVPFGYIVVKTPLQLYLLQAVHGFALALSYAGWTGIFTRHIDRGKESTEWGLNATFIGLGTGVAGAVGGWAVTRFGFSPVFIMVGVLSLIGAVTLFGLRNEIKGVFDNGLLNVPFRGLFHRSTERFEEASGEEPEER